jgi:ABC-type uncharacterized transport system substrate-binding protein
VARALLCLFLVLSGPVAGAASVLVVLSEPGGAYGEFAEALKAERGTRGGYTISVLPRTEFSPKAVESHDLVVGVGARALRTLVDSEVNVPVVSALVPKAAYDAMVAGDGRKWSAIYIDQPFSRQVALIRLALPEVRRIGVLADAEQPQRLQPLRDALSGTPLQLVSASFASEATLFTSLTQVLDQSQLFLVLPDSRVHNAGTVRNVLLTSFRARIPVVGFSAAYARAGAVMSLYSTPEQMARQATDVIIGWTRERAWPEARFPMHFTVAVNAHVARSLGLRIADAEALRDQLVQQESRP